MQESILLKAQIREQTGPKATAKIRQQGKIPAVIYGHKEQTVAISLDTHDLVNRLQHGGRLLDIEIGGKKQKVIIKDIQYDHLSKHIIHIDLMRVDISETVKVLVPIELKGAPKGAQEGGIIEAHADHIEVKCRATDIPEVITVSIKEMNIGDALHASDIELPQGVELVSDPSTLLAACNVVAVAKTTEELEAETPTAPEVIGQAKETEEEPPQEDAQDKKEDKKQDKKKD